MPRSVLFFNIPAFPIAVARVIDPGLRNHPVVIAAASSDRALIQAVSHEARQEGIYEGMPLYRAVRRCPQLRIGLPDPPRLRRARSAVEELLGNHAPLREPVAAGSCFLDVSGCSRLLGPGRDIAARLEKEIQQRLRLTGQVGVAGNKLVSRIAAGYLNHPGVCDVFPGSEAEFIAPLPVTQLPGIGRQRHRQLLQDLNLRQIGELAALRLPQLSLIFGSFAPLLQQRACGIDFAPVRSPKQQLEISAETILPHGSNSQGLLRAELCRMIEDCGFRLRQQQRTSRTLHLQLDFRDGLSRQGTLSLAGGTCQDIDLLKATDQLLERLLDRRTQLKSLRLRCLGLDAPDQLDLFELSQRQQHKALQNALDQVREKFGKAAIQRGRGMVAANASCSSSSLADV